MLLLIRDEDGVQRGGVFTDQRRDRVLVLLTRDVGKRHYVWTPCARVLGVVEDEGSLSPYVPA